MSTFGVKKCKILRPFLNTVNGSKCMGAASNPFILFIHFFFATKYYFVGVNKLFNHYSLKFLRILAPAVRTRGILPLFTSISNNNF